MKHHIQRLLVGGITAVLVAVTIGGALALAGHVAGSSLTGCLNLNSGTLTKLSVGDQPKTPCGANEAQVHLGSGDITAVNASTGLTGGGAGGDVSLAVAESYRLPQSCAPGQVAKSDGPSWHCGDDNDTTYSAGLGLDLNGTTFTLDANAVRHNVICSPGGFIRALGSDGSGACGPDLNTTYSGENFALSNQACAAGQAASGISASGNLVCQFGLQGPKGDPGASANVRWAVVRGSDGLVLRGSGVVFSFTKIHNRTGEYFVQFDRDVSSCAFVGQIVGTTRPITHGEIGVAIGPATQRNFISVDTYNSTGILRDSDFHLFVFC